MHRADYQSVLLHEARRLGATISLSCEVTSLHPSSPNLSVTLASGERIPADIIVGGDGLHSATRTAVLGYEKHPEESGDLAYRVVLPREKLLEEEDEFFGDVVLKKTSAIWFGPGMHVVLYSIRGGDLANLVLW